MYDITLIPVSSISETEEHDPSKVAILAKSIERKGVWTLPVVLEEESLAIMDGHHRWVATAMVDPSKEVGGYLVDFPGADLIRLLNAITVGKLGIMQGKEGSGSFDQFKEGPVRQELTRLAKEGSEFLKPEEVMQALEKFTKQKGESAIEAAVKKFSDNLSQLTFETPAGAPDRVDMPVIDPSKVKDADKIAMKALQGGEIDWNEPKA